MIKKIVSLLVMLSLTTSAMLFRKIEASPIMDSVAQMTTPSFLSGIDLPSYYKDPNVISDEEFFGVWHEDSGRWDPAGKINYAIIGLGTAETYAKAGNYADAKNEFLNFYRLKFKNFIRTIQSDGSTTQYLYYLLAKHNFMYAGNTAYIPRALYTAENNWGWKQEDITSLVTPGTSLLAFMLVSLEKDDSVIEIKSRKGEAEFVPHIEAVVNGNIVKFPAVMDANISAGTNSNITSSQLTAAAPDILKIAESATSNSKPNDPVDENTFRTYLRFDLSEIKQGDKVSKATLNLYARNAGEAGDKDMILFSAGETTWLDSTMSWLAGDLLHYIYSFDGEEGPSWFLNTAANHFYRIREDPIRFLWPIPIIGHYQTSNNPDVMYQVIRMIISYITMRPDPGYVASLDTAQRAENIPVILSYAAEHEAMTADVFTGIVKYLWTLNEYLYLPENFTYTNNWGIYETKGMFTTALYFEELSDSAKWLDKVYERIDFLSISNAFSDGSSIEVALGYVAPSIGMLLLDFVNVYEKTGKGAANIPFTDAFYDRMYKMTRYLMDISGPGVRDHQQGHSNSNTSNYRGRLLNAGRVFNEPNFLWAGTNGREGVMPDYTSVLYPIGNKMAMRSDWSEKALYLHMNNDSQRWSHGQRDDLSVIVFAYGRYLLADPGFYTQNADAVTNWLASTRAHNTILVNNTNQSAATRTDTNVNDTPSGGEISNWETNNGFDYINMETSGNANMKHTRGVLFVKNKFWIVTDLLEPTNKSTPNRYEQAWHFLPEAKIRMDESTKVLETTGFDDANIKIFPVGASDYEAVKNDHDLLGGIDKTAFANNSGVKVGYYSAAQSSVTNAEYASYLKANVVGNTMFNTVLFPMTSAENYDVNITALDTGMGAAQAAAFQIDYTKKGTNTTTTGLYYNLTDKSLAGEQTVETVSTDGQMFYAELMGNEWSSLNFMGGSHVKDVNRDIELLKSNSTIDGISVNWQSTNIYIDAMDDIALQDLTVYTNNRKISRVFVGGDSIPFKQQGRYVYFGSNPIIPDNTPVITPQDPNSGARPQNNHASSGGGVSITIPETIPAPTPIIYPDVEKEIPHEIAAELDNHWGRDEISELYETGIVKGDPRLRLSDNITRAEFVALVTRALDLDISDTISSFDDVNIEDWFADYVAAAEEAGLIEGASGLFRPGDLITREEMCKIVMAAYLFKNGESVPESEENRFADDADINEWAREYVYAAEKAGLVNGMDDGTFRPKDNALREQAFVILWRLINQ